MMSANNPRPSTSSLKGKRKKKMPANANPLFTQWLQEWKDEANEKGWKSAHTYGKALKTLKLFPLPLESGKDCKLLQNFGDKICKMLDEKLAQFKLNGGELPVQKEPEVNDASSTKAGRGTGHSAVTSNVPPMRPSTSTSHVSSSPAKRKGPSSISSSGSSSSRTLAHTISDDSGSEAEGRPPPQKKRAPSGNSREYVPAYRSGPYALILTLYRTMQAPGYRGHMLKTELIEAAQPLADKSFTIPDPGSRYTAWSSMGSVLRKGLVIKYSNPAKFFLTEKGQALAERLEDAENQNNTQRIPTPTIDSQARSRSLSENVVSSDFSNKLMNKAPTSISPGCQVFDTGDADLDAALNASLISGYQPDNNRSYNYTSDEEEVDLNIALNKSLEAKGQNNVGRADNIDLEDTDLEAALKASLKTRSSQDASRSKPPRSESSISSPQGHLMDNDVRVEDTDLDAAIKASLESSSLQVSLSNKPQDIPVDVENPHILSPQPSITVRPLPSLSPPIGGGADSDSNEEDEEMKRAIAESLLSYSQELSNSQCSSSDAAEEKTCNTICTGTKTISDQPKSPWKNICGDTSANDSVLVVSDDDDDDPNTDAQSKREIEHDSPLKLPRKTHEASLSPSTSPRPLPNLPISNLINSNEISTLEKPAVVLSSSQKMSNPVMLEHSKSTGYQKGFENLAPSLNFGLSNRCREDVVVIADDDVDNNNEFKSCGSKFVSDPAMDSGDELPDLDVPLFQRLINKGNIQSDLLKDSVSSKKQVSNTLKPSGSLDLSNGDALNSRTKQPVKVTAGFEKVCLQSESRTDVSNGHVLSIPSSARGMATTGKQKEINLNINSNTITSNPPPTVQSSVKSCGLTATSSLKPAGSALESSVPTCKPDFSLQPGSFDIILCLDNREFYGSKSSCKTLLPDLMKSGVQCDLRLLHVGDLLWIARERLGPQLDRVQGRELVLNYIVERKRMDDLVSSLTDGRMKEQKFRLKHCGLSETIILIEEYGSIQNFSLSEDRIKQSIANSQMIDGFKVKRCGSAKDAVSYLAIMTRFLQQNLSNKTLHAVPVEQMKSLKGQQSMHDSEQYLASFTAFNAAAVKHKDLRVTELFAKQLIQVPGVSAERAKAITSVYPTLTSLMDAYKKCDIAKDSEKLLAAIKYGKNERNLGIAVSRTLHMLYTQESLS